MLSPRNVIELLSPARDYECARAAIIHGADAVYIGAPQFSARKAAGNTIEDIQRTVSLAHTYGARVFVALNTLLTDAELQPAIDLAWQLYEANADALIVQDMGLVEKGLPPIELHASTQTDNRTVEKVQFLEQCGFKQVVLARELTAEQIAEIAKNTSVRLECFIHGALCVSYSGQCYMSYAVNGRSANRGECAQPCRLKYDLIDKNGQMLMKQKHVLSLKDQNQTANIAKLIAAGASTLKIEGRLKDAAYVANTTLHYRRIIDQLLSSDKHWQRASAESQIEANFVPDVCKTFNRGYTTYFVDGRKNNMSQPDTPKSIGEEIGKVAEVRSNSFRIATNKPLANGDGLCFRTPQGTYDGIRVNRAEGNLVFPLKMPRNLPKGTLMHRNLDVQFERLLTDGKTTRLIPICINVACSADGQLLSLTITDADVQTITEQRIAGEQAQDTTRAEQNMQRQLTKLGQTPFVCTSFSASAEAKQMWYAASNLNALRRQAVDAHIAARIAHFSPEHYEWQHTSHPYISKQLERNANVINSSAMQFYQRHGSQLSEWGYERNSNCKGQIVMTTKFCLMHAMGCCLRQQPSKRTMLPLTLSGENGQYSITTDCAKCEMIIRKK